MYGIKLKGGEKALKDDYTKQTEIEEFFKQFDKISDDFNKASSSPESSGSTGTGSINTFEHTASTRSARHAEKKRPAAQAGNYAISTVSNWFKRKFADERESTEGDMGKTAKRSKKKKYRLNPMKLIRFMLCIIIVCCIAGGIWVASVISKAPKIDSNNIYTMLAESSVIYDADGNVISNVGTAQLNRTIIEYDDLPKDLVNAFIAIEDKTFWDHSGFNFIRVFGAIKDSVFSGKKVGGTSTLTQQLARNIFLTDRMSEHSLNRKVIEAYYTLQIENELTKEQIIESYLNTINLGFNSYGVQAAAQAYFSKDVDELDLIECAALAALPKSPSSFALIKKLNPEDVDPESHVIIYQGTDYTYVYNGDASENRRLQTLINMCDQGLISEAERDAAKADDLLSHMNPNMSSITEISSYFADFAVEQVIKDLAYENKIDYSDAKDIVYNGGLKIYTTLNTDMQKIVEQEYANSANFPKVRGLKRDSSGNILNSNGRIMLFSKDYMFDENGNFLLRDDEYEWMPDGSLKLLKGNRLNFYRTVVSGQEDISLEFKSMYVIEDDVFYSIEGGNIAVPQQYKSRDEDGNAIISAAYFALSGDDAQKTFQSGNGVNLYVDGYHYTLRQKVIQPQSAMVITDYKTGQIQAMVGGRNTVGRLLFNRATATRQPGSSMKPITVYGAALQQSLDILEGGSTPVYQTYDNNGNPVENMYGTFMTAASVIDDAPLVVNGQRWPKNWYTGYRGLYTLRTAVEQSVNVCAVKVFEQVGPEYALQFAKKLGITSFVEEGAYNDMNSAAMALGGMTNGASPLEMASAYGTYANGGLYVEPIAYTKVTNKRDEVLIDKVPRSEQVVDPGVAFIMTDILHTTVTRGIANRAAIGTQPVAGKTGTTSDNYDAWFVGFTPQYTAAVWIGNDVNIELSEGSAAAAKLWSSVMKKVCAGIPEGSFLPAPENVISVTIDNKSGLLPTEISSYDDRSTVRSEYFIRGTEPTQSDNIHTYVKICSESRQLATPYCYYTEYKYGVRRPYLVDPAVEDLPYETPHYYCAVHNPNPSLYPVEGSGLDPTMAGQGGGIGSDVDVPGGGNTDNNTTDNDWDNEIPEWLGGGSHSQTPEPSPNPEPQQPEQPPREDPSNEMPEWLRTNR